MFFQCMACENEPSFSSFPLCEECARSLVPCPPLCSNCASPHCPREGECLRPWTSHPNISSFQSAYLLIEPGYTVLRRWKTRGSPIFDARVLNPTEIPKNKINTIIPIPHSPRREFELGESPARRIARALSRRIEIPLLEILEAPSTHQPSQAKLAKEDRLSRSIPFRVKEKPATSVLLVDDFFTSGATLDSAAQTLVKAGAREIHAYTLGIRVERIKR